MAKRPKVDKAKVLSTAADKTGSCDVVTYNDFYHLRLPGVPLGEWWWLFDVKSYLKEAGYVCHERQNREQWGNCGYTKSKTHFHKKADERIEMPILAAVTKCKRCSFEIRTDWKFCPNCGDKIVSIGKYTELCAKK